MIEAIHNYRQAAPGLGTSGQPSEGQLRDIAAAGYEVVINLALHDDPRYSLPDERAAVTALGMQYVHIPVQFDKPRHEDLQAFMQAMDDHRGRRIWVHCAANYRVSAFLALYRVRRLGWARDDAMAAVRDLWQPGTIWAAFIQAELES